MPSTPTRPRLLRALAAAGVVALVVALVMALVMAGRDDGSDGASGSAPSAGGSVVPAPTTPPTYPPDARIELGPTTAPEDFPGDDDHFLAVVRGYLEVLGVEAPASGARMVSVGREVCSLLSGGGAVASKLDSYASLHSLDEKGWTAVILAAVQDYCPALGPGYLADRAGPLPMTPAEKADLARFDMGLGGVTSQASDASIARLGERVCRRIDANPDRVLAGLDPRQDPAAVSTVLAVVLAYCPEHGAALRAALSGTA